MFKDDKLGGKASKKRKSVKDCGDDAHGARHKAEEAAAQQEIHVQVQDELPDSTGALILSFRDGPPPVEALHGSEGGLSCSCRAYSISKHREKQVLRSVTAESETLEFEGKEDMANGEVFRYLIGLYDPESSTVTIADPCRPSTNIVQLHRRVKAISNDGSLSQLSKEQARDSLVDSFGSKRVKMTHKQRQGQLLEKEGNEDLEVLERELRVKKEEADAVLEAAGYDAKAEGPNDLAPPCNQAAESVLEVYKREDVIPKEEWDALLFAQMLEVAQNPEGEGAATLPAFVRGHLKMLISCPDKNEKRRLAKMLMYITFLILFQKLSSKFNKGVDALKRELGIPFPIGSKFLKVFAESANKGYVKTQACKDKLMLALGVACLLAFNYEVPLDVLAADLAMSPDRLGVYFRELGAVVTKPRGKKPPSAAAADEETAGAAAAAAPPQLYTAALKLPLVFPKRARGAGKR